MYCGKEASVGLLGTPPEERKRLNGIYQCRADLGYVDGQPIFVQATGDFEAGTDKRYMIY